MTPHELNLHITEYAARIQRESEEQLVLTYLGAYWQRVKRMPDLKKLLQEPKPKKKQTDEAMFAQIKKMHDRMKGGK